MVQYTINIDQYKYTKKYHCLFPVSDDDELIAGTAKYQDGVVTLKIPIPNFRNIPVT